MRAHTAVSGCSSAGKQLTGGCFHLCTRKPTKFHGPDARATTAIQNPPQGLFLVLAGGADVQFVVLHQQVKVVLEVETLVLPLTAACQ